MRRSSTRRVIAALCCGTVFLAGLALVAPSKAADIVPGPYTKAPPLVASSWTGFYAGLGLGFRSTSADLTTTSVLQDGVARDLTRAVLTQPFDGTGFRVNPYAGFNWQVAPSWIVGVEGDIGFGDKTTALPGFAPRPGPARPPLGSTACRSKRAGMRPCAAAPAIC